MRSMLDGRQLRRVNLGIISPREIYLRTTGEEQNNFLLSIVRVFLLVTLYYFIECLNRVRPLRQPVDYDTPNMNTQREVNASKQVLFTSSLTSA
ncbi:CLUMA_CG014744, isoform A [Clunio marinus]|uniref:CLUMA_CG014744, isoform A n=1 Tax=Clunio marinus TaxID=568069 RepID=A0A1J1IQ67_9DIPT|nr:CLUMA_CG014744, isoform A [Clunio marinus]